MAEYLSEQEQVDRIKTFIRTQGSNVLTGVMLAVAAYFGFQWWQNQQVANQVQAANQFNQVETLYSGLAVASDEGSKTKFYSAVKKLSDEYPSSTYTLNALFLQAQQQAQDSKFVDAEKTLIQATTMDHDDAGMKAISQLRLAQIQLSQEKSQAAIDTLAKVTLDAFSPTKQELLGDAYVQLKQLDKAKEAYNAAWTALSSRQEPRPILRLKMEEIGLKPKLIEAPSVLKDPA